MTPEKIIEATDVTLAYRRTRPQLIKLSPICDAFDFFKQDHQYIDTGQHYDSALSENIRADLGLRAPVLNLKVGSHSHAKQTAIIMERLETEIDQIRPNMVLVYGDTNSTLAATLVAAKKNIPVAHIEAGLRSYNKKMPEELNRVATDHLSDILFCPTETAVSNLRNEGLGSRSVFVGDVMADLIFRDFESIESQNILTKAPYLVATIHRAENTDYELQLKSILFSLGQLSLPILFFAHPRLIKRMQEFALSFPSNVKLMEPVPHNQIIAFVLGSEGVITDSGGLQKEAYILKVPCTTLREETEWPETLFNNWNVLVKDVSQLSQLLNIDRRKSHIDAFGDGRAAHKIVSHVVQN